MIEHIIVYSGCWCGAAGRGKPEVPVEWLKSESRSHGLLKNTQLTISCCLGPCDLTNVVKVAGPSTDVWLGNLHRFDVSLVDWAPESKTAGALMPLPDRFEAHRFNPFEPKADAGTAK